MPTLRDLITDVLADPEKYEGVFVTEREPVAEKYAYLNSPSAEFGGSTAEMFSETLRRVSDGLASAVQANSYNRPPRGLHYGAIDMPFYTSAGAMGYRSVPIQLEDGMARLPALEIPSTEPDLADVHRRFIDAGPTNFAEHDRPDHYRVTQGRCSCGFTSPFRDDLNAHLRDDLFELADGVPHRWRVCERCRASSACREVVVTENPLPIDWPSEAPISPNGSVFHREYRCDNCARGI